MKKLLLVICVAAMHAGAHTQLQITYHYKKLKASEGMLENGVKTGTWKYWNVYGLLVKQETYANGKLDGPYFSYYDDRDVMMSLVNVDEVERKIYRKGVYKKICLPLQQQGKTGYMQATGHYRDGEKDSTWEYWNYHGRMYRQDTYSLGRRNGICREYKASGELISESTCRNDTLHGPYRKFLSGITVIEQGQYFCGKKRGLWLEAADDGWAEYTYKEDILNGPCTTYTAQRKVKEICTYVNGKKEGAFTGFPENAGREGMHYTGRYEGGVQKGIFSWYSKEGYCLDQVYAENFLRSGAYTRYFPDGRVSMTGYYTNDKPDSTWIEYSEQGLPEHYSRYAGPDKLAEETRWWPDTKILRWTKAYENGETIRKDYDKNGKLVYITEYKNGLAFHKTGFYSNGKKKFDFLGRGEMMITEEHWYPSGKRMMYTEAEPHDIVETWYAEDGREITYEEFEKKHPGLPELTLLSDPDFRYYIEESPPVVEPSLEQVDTEEIFRIVEVMPQFPGGDQALGDFLMKNITYPPIAREQQITGKVFAEFTIEKDGSVTDAHIIRGVHKSVDDETLRVIALMPRWIPGKQGGRPVRCKMLLPVKFSLQ